MMTTERIQQTIRQLLPGASQRVKSPEDHRRSSSAMVRLVDSVARPESTAIGQRLVAVLSGSESLAFERVVEAAAEDLYQEELRKGAGVLDIGLFGSRLFHGDVIRELHAGDGIYWVID
jgi:hypothetical protein